MITSKPDMYRKLEEKMVKYSDLVNVKAEDNNEKFVFLDRNKIPNSYIKGMNDAKKFFGPRILVRDTVYKKLLEAQAKLTKINKNFSLYVTYGYRTLEFQTEKFLEKLNKISQNYFENPIDLYEEVHRYIAVPSVAGHPTGGAIDIYIKDMNTNQSLDFGSSLYDFSTKDCYVFTDKITQKQKANRMLLRKILTTVGFAPFDGEWWHFSYGDKEWAYYYKKKKGRYTQLMAQEISI